MNSIPTPILRALENKAVLAISISGGKDSQALLSYVCRIVRGLGFDNEIFAIHADLGEAEWVQSKTHCQIIAKQNNVKLEIVGREGGLLGRMEERLEKLRGTGKPMFPSAMQRYCTSDLKRNPINTFLRRYSNIISVEGIRASESLGRAKKPVVETRAAIHNSKRFALTWNAILDWSEDDVWVEIGTSRSELETRREWHRSGLKEKALRGWKAHPAYVFGNQRVSCALCILATKNDLTVGAEHHPELLKKYIGLEERSQSTFKHHWSIRELLQEDQPDLFGQPI